MAQGFRPRHPHHRPPAMRPGPGRRGECSALALREQGSIGWCWSWQKSQIMVATTTPGNPSKAWGRDGRHLKGASPKRQTAKLHVVGINACHCARVLPLAARAPWLQTPWRWLARHHPPPPQNRAGGAPGHQRPGVGGAPPPPPPPKGGGGWGRGCLPEGGQGRTEGGVAVAVAGPAPVALWALYFFHRNPAIAIRIILRMGVLQVGWCAHSIGGDAVAFCRRQGQERVGKR